MLGYASTLVFWLWFIAQIRRKRPNRRLIATVYFFTSALAYSFDKAVHVILDLYRYSLSGLTNDWAAWLLDAILYPVVGCVFVLGLQNARLHKAVHVLGWTIGFSLLETIGVWNEEIIYTGWRFEWSVIVYLGAFTVLTFGLKWWNME